MTQSSQFVAILVGLGERGFVRATGLVWLSVVRSKGKGG